MKMMLEMGPLKDLAQSEELIKDYKAVIQKYIASAKVTQLNIDMDDALQLWASFHLFCGLNELPLAKIKAISKIIADENYTEQQRNPHLLSEDEVKDLIK